MIEVIGNMRSRAFRVLWMLEELGEPYVHRSASPHSAEVLKWNPAGKIPVLVEDGVAITDSTAILEYLADKRGRFSSPSGTLERAKQDSWTNFLLDEFDACLWAAARHSFILPQEKRVPDLKATLKWEFARSLKSLASRMGEGPFLMGDQMMCLISFWLTADYGPGSQNSTSTNPRSRSALSVCKADRHTGK